ncbi:MAG TPA: SGNH/GDSL hydrolase family protein [Kofleriaceae bacterium]|jgi:lysophospholipase L1-like esterase
MFSRYVAIGDSSTEGLDDPDGRGGYRGWADRLAEHAARAYPGLQYANVAVRGKSAAEIKASQLATAVAMRPDLATVVAGMNDLLRRNWSAVRVAGEVGEMVHALRALGATVVMFTIPDVSSRMRLGRLLSQRTAELNVELRKIAAREQAVLLDLASYELASDPRMWAVDRLHGNPAGHARIGNELARLLGIPGVTEGGLDAPIDPLPMRPRRERLVEDLTWIAKFVAPWALRRLRGRTLGDGREPKRPRLTPVV